MLSIRQRIAATVLALLATTIGVAAPAVAEGGRGGGTATPTDTVTLAGSLTGASGNYDDAWVTAYRLERWCDDFDYCSQFQWAADATVDSSGAFTLTVPQNASYALVAVGDGFVSNSYGRTASADPSEVTDGTPVVVTTEDITGLDIDVKARPSIRGTITLPASALQSSGFEDWSKFFAATTINVYSKSTDGEGTDTTSMWQVAKTKSFRAEQLAEHMTFSVSVDPGVYRVSFTNYWTGEVFFGGDSLDSATDVIVAEDADATGIDFTPAALPTISGTLMAPEGSTRDKRMVVAAVRFTPGDDGQPIDDGLKANYTIVAADGTYRLPVTPGEYAVITMGDTMYGFAGPEPECFATQGFDKGCFPTRVSVGTEGVAGLDMTLRLFPRFTGTVIVPDTVSVSDVYVSAEKWQHESTNATCVDNEDGCQNWMTVALGNVTDNGDGTASYVVAVREPGTYRLVFSGGGAEQLIIGGDAKPDAEAVNIASIAFTEVTRDFVLLRQPWVVGSVNPEVLTEGAFNVNVTIYADRGDGDWVDVTSAPVDLNTLTFSMPVSAGEYAAVLTWSTYDEFGNEQMHKAFLSGTRMFKVFSGSNASVSFDTTVPSAPLDPQVVGAGDGSVTVGWSAPESDGGLPVTGYTVTAVDAATGEPTDTTCAAAGNEGSCTVEGLENLREYSFSVTATNDAGDSDPATTGLAVPHVEGFAVWTNRQTVTADAEVRVWVLGANPTDTVTVKVAGDTLDASVNSFGDGYVDYTLDSGSTAVRSGKVKVYAKAVRTTETGRTKRLNAKTTIYVPKTKVRGIAREGGTITARITAAAPDSEISISIDGEELCAGTADRNGRLACTFDSPVAGDYTLTTTVNGVETAANAISVRPIRRL